VNIASPATREESKGEGSSEPFVRDSWRGSRRSRMTGELSFDDYRDT
jgi:hypothetical protein